MKTTNSVSWFFKRSCVEKGDLTCKYLIAPGRGAGLSGVFMWEAFMNTRRIITICLLALLLPSCAFFPAFTQEEYDRRRRDEMDMQFNPYLARNTIEGYREFIAKYPKNMYLETALDKIDNLAAYTEFVERYPGNRHAVTARNRVDQATIKDCESIDTIQGYRQFLERYPDNIFVQTAQDRLQDLEFRDLAGKIQQQYSFDLLMYRLHVKRLQKELPQAGGVSLGDFTLYASLESVQGRLCFKSHLIYSVDLGPFSRAPAALQQQIFDALVAPLIGCLARQFPPARGIDAFSFALTRSAQRFYGNEKTALEYVFPAREALLFAQNRCSRSQLFVQSSVRQTVLTDEKPQAGSHAAVKLDGPDIMEKSAARRRVSDSIVSASWRRVSRDGTVHQMKTIRKWKDFQGAGGYSSKSVVNYIHSQNDRYADAILTAADTGGSLQYWYIFSKGDAGRTPDIDNYRPPAERDFPLAEFTEIPVGQETHAYEGTAACGSIQCYRVNSTPASGSAAYGRRTSFIDQQSLQPLKIEYFDRSGALWKTARFDWQETGKAWFWQRAEIVNEQSGAVTTITVTEVKANPGLAYIDFSSGVLSRH
jgi:hypothetical protein